MITVLICALLVALELYIIALICEPRLVLRWTRRQLLRPTVAAAALLPARRPHSPFHGRLLGGT
jgi:hypothetical protein